MKFHDQICRILGCHRQPRKAPVRFNWAIGRVEPKAQTKGNMVTVTITNEQKVKVTLTPVTATGKPAQLDGVPNWSVVSGESTIEAAADGRSAFLISSDSPGDTEVMVEADADVGAGVETISDMIKLTVEGAKAQSLGLSVGTPEAK